MESQIIFLMEIPILKISSIEIMNIRNRFPFPITEPSKRNGRYLSRILMKSSLMMKVKWGLWAS